MDVARTTHTAYLWVHILSTPLWAIFNMLPFILYKDLHATPLQITVAVTLKPLVSIFSVYWSSSVIQRRDRLLSNVIWARVLSLLPFFFFPFIDNAWYFIATFGFYMLLARGVIPAWMEILNINLSKRGMGQTFATGSFVGYCGNIGLAFLIGDLLDNYFHAWRWLFPLTAFISLCAVFVSAKIPISEFSPQETPKKNWKEQLAAPWKSVWGLLKQYPDFRKFQWGFMLGGAGTMIVHPILPQFFIDNLNLSYTEMATAFACCKGLGFALTAPLWVKALQRVSVFRFNSWPPLWVCFFSLCLLLAQIHVAWVFVAYFCYGIMQGGSEIGWNLSGPLFAQKSDSSAFSNVNILAVGIRGCIVPALGSILAYAMGPMAVIIAGATLCLLAFATFSFFNREVRATQPFKV